MSKNKAANEAIIAGAFIVFKSTGLPQTELKTFAAIIPAIEYRAA